MQHPDLLAIALPALGAGLAVGVLLGVAFIHLIPDAVARHGDVDEVCLAVLGGLSLFFVLEKLVRWRHDHTISHGRRASTVQPICRVVIDSAPALGGGGVIYIAASDFIPALHSRVADPRWGQVFTFAIGIGLMKSVVVLELLIAIL